MISGLSSAMIASAIWLDVLASSFEASPVYRVGDCEAPLCEVTHFEGLMMVEMCLCDV